MRSITAEEITTLNTEEFKGQIFVVDSQDEADKAVEYLSGFTDLGFDTETRPSFRKGKLHGVSLIQLATDERCYLFRLNWTGSSASLIQLLSDARIRKIGLSLKDDFTNINRRMKFTPRGFIDLQKIVSGHNIADASLQKIYAILFRKRISKSQRLSNWESEKLSEAQKNYAALDAWACLKIYKKLNYSSDVSA